MAKTRKGNKYTDLLTGKEEVIKEVAEDGTVTFESGLAVADMSAFQYVGNDTPKEEPVLTGFEITKGRKLTYKGERIECGSLKVDDVCATVPGGVILIVTLDSGKQQVKIYDIEEEKFISCFHTADTIRHFSGKTLLDHEGSSLNMFYNTDKTEHVVKTEGGEEKVEEITPTLSVLVVNGKGEVVDSSICDMDAVEPITTFCATAKKRGKTVVTTFTARALTKMTDVDGEEFYAHAPLTDIASDYLASEVLSVAVTPDRDEGTGTGSFSRAFVAFRAHRFGTPKAVEAITPVLGGNEKDLGLLVIMTNEIRYFPADNLKPFCKAYGEEVVKTAKEYPYLLADGVGGSKLSNPRHCVFTLVNNKYEVKRICVDKTSDRGYVTRIE